MKPLIIYHANCPDGTGAALAAYLKFGEGAEYHPKKFGDPPPTPGRLSDRFVYILDFSYPRERLIGMSQAAISLRVIDHHKTAAADLEGFPWATFDMDHSGAVLAWRHFFPDQEIPELLLYIEDRDLWRWALPHSLEINAALHAYGLDFRKWVQFVKCWQSHKADLVQEGRAILMAREEMMRVIVDKAERVCLGGFEAQAANAPVLVSEVASVLAERFPPLGIAWHWDGVSQIYLVSLRSVGEFDVSRLAREFGGGGHRNAAGFTCMDLPWRGR